MTGIVESLRSSGERTIARRRVAPDFAATSGSHVWGREDCFQADFCNAYTLLLTEESQFVRIVSRHLAAVQDETLRAQVKGWLAQETSHGIQHTRAQQVLVRQGLRYETLLKVLRIIDFGVFARLLGSRLLLYVVAGLEHFNTLLGEMFLAHPACMRDADERMAMLLRWHFAEEIEHRAVIHDMATHLGMGYVARLFTGLLAFFFYASNLFVLAWAFAIQRGGLLQLSTYRSAARFLFVDERFVQYFFGYLWEYSRLRFHPLNRRTDGLAEPVLAGLAEPALAGVDPARTL